MTDQETHFLEWRQFRMACHKKPNEVYTSTSFWDQTTCPQCLQRRPAGDDQQAEPLLDGRGVAEDVYYVPRDGGAAIGLNQLMQVPAQLSEVELRAIDEMAGRSWQSMGCTVTGEAWRALRGGGSVGSLAHGMYYVGPGGSVYIISQDKVRPDLSGPAMDFARATVEAGRANLDKLRVEAERLR